MISYKKNYLRSLFIWGFIPSFIISSQIVPAWNIDSQNILGINAAIAETRSLENLDQNLSELDTSYDNFVSSLVKYLDELQQAVQQKRPANAVILNDTYEKLQALSTSQKKLTETIQKIGVTIPKNLNDTAKNLEVTIQKMANIIEPLKGGLEPEAVTEVQKFLDFFERRSISAQYYGTYGFTTQEEVEKFFAEKSRNLNNQINELKEYINKERPNWEKSLASSQPKVNIEALYQEIEQLKAENASLKEELSKYQQSKSPNFNWFVILVSLIVIGVLITIVYQTIIKQGLFPKKSDPKPYNMTHNDILVIEEEIYELVAQEFKEQFKLFEERLNKLEKSSKQKVLTPGITENAELESNTSEIEFLKEQSTIFNPYDKLLTLYNNNPEELEKQAIQVTEKKQEINIDNGFHNTFFEKSESGDYWIVNLAGNEYLVPKANIIINDNNYSSFQELFECYGYKQGESHSVKLLQPVRVSRNGQQEEWEFIQLGVIECKINLLRKQEKLSF
jgi:hypothetical protein